VTERRNVPIARPSTGDEEWQAVREPLVSGWLTQGPKVAEFERGFSERHGVRHAVATTSCTTALHLLLTALGVGPGDEVIVPAFTWVATANVVLYCGATPVFVDVEPATYNIDPKQVAQKITPRTRAVIPVHLFGLCADMEALADVAPGVALIEDAACAVGASRKGRPAGSLGLAGAFSFHPRKPLTTGEGGMLVTNDDGLAEKAVMLRNHGASASEEARHRGPRPHLLPEFNLLGFNYRMTDLQAAVGLVQLSKLDGFLEERARGAELYQRELADLPWLRTPAAPEGDTHSWQAYVCWIDRNRAPRPRDEMMDWLQERGVHTRPGTHAVHMLGLYRERYSLEADDFPAARDCAGSTLALPLHNRMSEDDYRYVVEALHEIT
jgi:perosamine synthetase